MRLFRIVNAKHRFVYVSTTNNVNLEIQFEPLLPILLIYDTLDWEGNIKV